VVVSIVSGTEIGIDIQWALGLSRHQHLGGKLVRQHQASIDTQSEYQSIGIQPASIGKNTSTHSRHSHIASIDGAHSSIIGIDGALSNIIGIDDPRST
jgi:hypothetical protein